MNQKKLDYFLKNKFYPVFKYTFVGFSILPFLFFGFAVIIYAFNGEVGIFGADYEEIILKGHVITQAEIDEVIKLWGSVKSFFATATSMALLGMFYGLFSVVRKSKKAD